MCAWNHVPTPEKYLVPTETNFCFIQTLMEWATLIQSFSAISLMHNLVHYIILNGIDEVNSIID